MCNRRGDCAGVYQGHSEVVHGEFAVSAADDRVLRGGGKAVWGASGVHHPTGVLVDAAYAIIGVQAGGTLTKGALRQFAQALPVIFGVIGLMIVSSLAAAWFIAAVWGYTLLDSYLATVPGGVYAVLAFAHESGGDPLVTVVQVMRVIAMLVVGAYAPQIVGFVSRRHAGSAHDRP